MSTALAAPVRVQTGSAVAMFAYDVAAGIDLARVQRLMGTPEAIPKLRPTPQNFQFRPAPVRIVEAAPTHTIGPFRTTEQAECVLYDFGAVSVSYRVPIEGPLEALGPLSLALYENAELLADSRARVLRLMERLDGALDRPHLADPIEDYVIWQVAALAPGDSIAHLPRHAEGERVARLLRVEADPLSSDEVENALSAHLAYGPTTSSSWTGTRRWSSVPRRTTCSPCSSTRTCSSSSCDTWTTAWTRSSPRPTPP